MVGKNFIVIEIIVITPFGCTVIVFENLWAILNYNYFLSTLFIYLLKQMVMLSMLTKIAKHIQACFGL